MANLEGVETLGTTNKNKTKDANQVSTNRRRWSMYDLLGRSLTLPRRDHGSVNVAPAGLPSLKLNSRAGTLSLPSIVF